MVLNATLRQIDNIAASQADVTQKLFDMTEGSVNLTQNLKEQMITQKKLNALEK